MHGCAHAQKLAMQWAWWRAAHGKRTLALHCMQAAVLQSTS